MLPRLALVVLALSLGAPASARAQMTEEWDESWAGIRTLHRYGVDAAGVRQSYYVSIVDLTDPDVSVQVALNEDTWGGTKEPVRAMADRHGAAIAVNGDYWSWGTDDPSQGTTALDGFCYRAHPERSAIAFDETLARVEIGQWGTWPIADPPPDDCPAWFDHAIAAGPQFIFDGVARWDESPNASDPSVPDINGDTFFGAEAWAWDTGRQPNTAVGISADGSTMILMTCDGRGAGEAGGCRMASDVSDLLLEHGAHQGLKLDSGGSTTFYRAGHVLNFVSDGAATAPRERAVVDALLVHSRRLRPDCALAGAALEMDDGGFCFVREGRYFWAVEAGTNDLAHYTWAAEGDRDSYGRWRFDVEVPGTYRVEAFVPDAGPASAAAPYWIGDEAAPVVADQEAARGGWIDLGEHDLAAGPSEVRLEDNTGEPFRGIDDPGSRRVLFDTIRLTPVDVELPDAGAAADAGSSIDGGGGDASAPRSDAGPGEPPSEGGCGCRAAGGSDLPTAALLALLLVSATRARSRRARSGRAR